jgi:hypothetical protein
MRFQDEPPPFEWDSKTIEVYRKTLANLGRMGPDEANLDWITVEHIRDWLAQYEEPLAGARTLSDFLLWVLATERPPQPIHGQLLDVIVFLDGFLGIDIGRYGKADVLAITKPFWEYIGRVT